MKLPDNLKPVSLSEQKFDESVRDIIQLKTSIDYRCADSIYDYHIYPQNCYVFVEFLKLPLSQSAIDLFGSRFATSLNNEWKDQEFKYEYGYVGLDGLYNQVKGIELRFHGTNIDVIFVFSLVREDLREKWKLSIHISKHNSGYSWCTWCALVFAPSPPTY